MPEQRSIIERLVFRFVRKHIAGPTSESALQAISKVNAKGLRATLTLLNDNVSNAAKARYNANAYIQLAKQISRLHLNSDISLRPSQVGYGLDNALMRKSIEDIEAAAEDGKIRLWLEHDGAASIPKQLSLYRDVHDGYSNVGVEIEPAKGDPTTLLDGDILPKDMVKVRCFHLDGDKKQLRDTVGTYTKYIDRLLSKRAAVSVWEHDLKMVRRLAAANPRYRKDIAFEVPYGYNEHRMKKLAQGKLEFSVYVPFGKDWVPYVTDRLAEGRLRRIAVALLDGKSGKHGS